MAKLKHFEISENWYFITSTLLNQLRLFKRPECAEIALNVLQARLKDGRFRLDEFIIMPDHMHLIIIPMDVSISRVVGEIKRGISRLINMYENISHRSLWISEYYERIIRSEKELYYKRRYIWYNPVRAGLSSTPEAYKYSSANQEVRLRFALE